MFRKADRDNLAAVKTLLVGLAKEHPILARAADLKDILEGMDKLLQSQAALSKESPAWSTLLEHWSKCALSINENFNGMKAQMDKLQADFDQWPIWRNAVDANLKRLFERMQPEYPIAKELNGKIILMWPDRMETIARVKPKSPKKPRK